MLGRVRTMACPDKQAYFTEKAAIQASQRYMKEFHKPSRVYWCDKCDWWHLTSRVLPEK